MGSLNCQGCRCRDADLIDALCERDALKRELADARGATLRECQREMREAERKGVRVSWGVAVALIGLRSSQHIGAPSAPAPELKCKVCDVHGRPAGEFDCPHDFEPEEPGT